MNWTDYINFTQTPEITQKCYEWCKEAQIIHVNNIAVSELSLVFVALVGIMISNLFYGNDYLFINKFGFDEIKVEKIALAGLFFSFVMLVIFLIRQLFFV